LKFPILYPDISIQRQIPFNSYCLQMKQKLILLSAGLMACIQLHATVLTVSNNPVGGAQFSNFQSAYDAAVNGDTLMLEGTNMDYSLNCASFNKSLVVVGSGIHPQKQNPGVTRLLGSACNGNFRMSSGMSGSRFYGVLFPGYMYMENQVNNLVFEDCLFESTFYFSGLNSSNIAFRNCVFNANNNSVVGFGASNNFISNLIFTNCIFDGFIEGNGNQLVTMLVDHCVFLSTYINFNNVFNATVSNSIFMNLYPNGTTNTTFVNNICRVAGTFPTSTSTGNSGSGNINNTNPNFVNYSLGDFYNPGYDFRLQAGSPAINAGADGTDLGVYGGTSKFSRYLEVLHHPVVRAAIIQNTTIGSGGTLNVQINASKPNEN